MSWWDTVDWQQPLNPDCSLNQGLRGLWMGTPYGFGGNRMTNIANFGNHGTLTNMDPPTDWVPTERGMALDFDGSNDHVVCGPISSIFPSTTQCTVAVACRLASSGSVQRSLFGIDEFTAGSANMRVQAHAPWSDGNIYWDWAGTTNGTTRLTVSGLSFDTNWDHFVFTVGGGLGMRCYRKGVLVGSNAATPTRTQSSVGFWLSRLHTAGGLNYYYPGRIHHVIVLDRAVEAVGAATLYDQYQRGFPDMLNRPRRRVYSVPDGAPPATNRRRRVLICGRAA